jgi:hypothetical protein
MLVTALCPMIKMAEGPEIRELAQAFGVPQKIVML